MTFKKAKKSESWDVGISFIEHAYTDGLTSGNRLAHFAEEVLLPGEHWSLISTKQKYWRSSSVLSHPPMNVIHGGYDESSLQDFSTSPKSNDLLPLLQNIMACSLTSCYWCKLLKHEVIVNSWACDRLIKLKVHC